MPTGSQRLEDMLAYLVVETFIGDAISLVWKKFGNDIEVQCRDEDSAAVGKKRKLAYKEWSKLEYPLSKTAETVQLWSTTGRRRREERFTTWQLLKEIAGPDARVQLNMSPERWTTKVLGEKLVEMTRETSPRRVKAPLVHGGLAHHALPFAQERLFAARRSHSTKADIEERLGMALGEALAARKVEFVPYHEPATGQSHRFAAVPEWWLMVSRHSQVARASSEEFSGNEQEALNEATLSPTTPWNLPQKPQQIKWFTHKTVLPQEWDLGHASLGARDSREPYLVDTYEWVRDRYDGNKELHRMALLWAMMYLALLPQIGVPEKVSIKKTKSPMEASNEVVNIPWITPKRKGVHAPLPFLVMLTCVIISFFEPESPLRRHLARNNNHLGNAWTTKHCGWSIIQRASRANDGCSHEVHQRGNADTHEPRGGEVIGGSRVASVQM
jgi:hypothetical protein